MADGDFQIIIDTGSNIEFTSVEVYNPETYQFIEVGSMIRWFALFQTKYYIFTKPEILTQDKYQSTVHLCRVSFMAS